ncbi:MAG: 23S rRNA (cytidine(2498)-2'-O)-methyltransferase RlmM [Casimicrobiaceae bacterium]
MSANRPTPVVVAYCRAGFEPEATADLARLMEAAGTAGRIDANNGDGFVTASLEAFDAKRWSSAFDRHPPVFVRGSFIGTGPHALASPADAGRPDRVTPIVDAIAALPQRASAGAWVEFPDTNEGKALSTLARALAPRVDEALRELGLVDARHALRQHVFLRDRNTAHVGTSSVTTGSPWPMGIPRLRMPHGAPSRSTAKLAEAFLVFLGDGEAELLRPGMRAVDLGAAPGGWTWQLAHRGLKVIAVDNGALKGDVAIDPRVTHVRADGLTWRPRTPVDWLVCDIVLQPIRIAELVAGWIADGAARRAIFNLKLPMKRRYDEVERCRASIEARMRGARVRHTLALKQLYHDREEVTGYLAIR